MKAFKIINLILVGFVAGTFFGRYIETSRQTQEPTGQETVTMAVPAPEEQEQDDPLTKNNRTSEDQIKIDYLPDAIVDPELVYRGTEWERLPAIP